MCALATAKVAVTIDEQLLREVDRWVETGEFPNRSRAFQAALRQLKAKRSKHARLLAEAEFVSGLNELIG